MRSLEGSWFAPVVGLTVVLGLSGGCAGSVGVTPLVLGDAGLAGDAGPGWPVVAEPVEAPLQTVAPRHAGDVCTDLVGCPSAVPAALEAVPLDTSERAVPAPSAEHEACAAASDCASGRCVRGVCTTGRSGEPCDSREHCETFCNLATHRCGDLCIDPLACR